MNPKQASEAAKTNSPEPDEGPAEERTESNMEDCVPLAALAMPDDSEQMQEPQVGDKVQYNVEGEVTRIEGDDAYVKKTAVNGQEIKGAEPQPTDEMADLEDMAKTMPEG